MIIQPITKEEVRKIFDKEAVLIGACDVVPESRARVYFGEAGLTFSERTGKFEAYGVYGIGERCDSYKYFTLKGLELAATYCNINMLLDEEEAK